MLENNVIDRVYSAKALSKLNPNYVIISSTYYDRFLGIDSKLYSMDIGYPEVRDFFEKLTNEELGYKILKVFNSEYPCPVYGKEKIIVFFRDKKL